MTSTTIADLSARGTDLREPASRKDIAAFEAAMDVQLDGSWHELYSLFNGFRQADRRSLIYLWGLDEIVRRNSAETHLRQGRRFAIGDRLFDSDFLVSDLGRASSVSLLFEKTCVAESVADFIVLLTSGSFDLLAADPA